ncbi:MAG: chemotaxis protein CheX [Treponemataceae bacterium]
METSIRASFIEAATLILNEIGFTGLSVGNTKDDSRERIDMIAAIGLVGDLKGHFVISIGSNSILSFVKSVSGHLEMHNENPDDPHYRKALLGEITNQIGGRAVALLSLKGIECMITPPTVITGQGVETALPEADDRLTFPVWGTFGRFDCAIALKRSKVI